MVKFDWGIVAKIFVFPLVNLKKVKNNYSLNTFNYPISHLQLDNRNSQIWLKLCSWNFNSSIS